MDEEPKNAHEPIEEASHAKDQVDAAVPVDPSLTAGSGVPLDPAMPVANRDSSSASATANSEQVSGADAPMSPASDDSSRDSAGAAPMEAAEAPGGGQASASEPSSGSEVPTPASVPTPNPTPNPAPNPAQSARPASTSGLAIAGLILGILAILGSIIPIMNIITAPFGILGLVFAIIGYNSVKSGKHTGKGVATAGIVLSALALVVTVGMYGCAGAVAGSGSNSSSAAVSSSTSSKSETSSASASAAKSATGQKLAVGSATIVLPVGWTKETNTSGGTYYAAPNGKVSLIYPGSSQRDASKADAGKVMDVAVESLLESWKASGTPDVKETTVSGYPARRVSSQGAKDGLNYTIQLCVAVLPDSVVWVTGISQDGKHDPVIAAVLDSIQIEQGTSGSAQSSASAAASSSASAQSQQQAQEAQQPAPAASDGVTPELKEMLDSYEAVMDEYVAFMQKYADSGYSASMMSDYMTMLNRYTEFAQKVDALDKNKMSKADAAYYVEVTSRVAQKLLAVAG